jgi:hypothetical protein
MYEMCCDNTIRPSHQVPLNLPIMTFVLIPRGLFIFLRGSSLVTLLFLVLFKACLMMTTPIR